MQTGLTSLLQCITVPNVEERQAGDPLIQFDGEPAIQIRPSSRRGSERGTRDRATLPQRGAPAPGEFFTCETCEEELRRTHNGALPQDQLVAYRSRRALTQHIRHRHPAVHDQRTLEDLASRRNVTIPDQEILLIAELDIKLREQARPGVRGQGLNQLISDKHPERPNLERIRNIRKSAKYKKVLADLETGKLDPTVDIAPVMEGQLPAAAGERDTADNAEDLNAGADQPNQSRQLIEEINRIFDELDTDGLVGLSGQRCKDAGPEEVRLACNKVLEAVGCKLTLPTARAGRVHPPPPANESNKQRKRRLWQKAQRKFKLNPTACCKAILSDSLDQHEGVGQGELGEYWGNLFSGTADFVPFNTQHTRGVDHTLAKPIQQSEVRKALSKLKSTSPGADKVDRAILRRVGCKKLTVLYNLFLKTSFVPVELKEGRVTLLPKKDRPTLPSEFRPITVSSMILRTFHTILNGRLAAIPIRETQKGFMKRDGIAENTAILKSLLKWTGKRKTSLYLCLLDVSKAFDSVAHEAIIAAIRRLGVPELLVQYVANLYTDAHIWVCGRRVKLGRGVRQGCPLSTFLFNAVIDMCLDGVKVAYGLKLADHLTLADLFFADDGVLVSNSKIGLSKLLEHVVDRFGKVGLKLNAEKSQSLAVVWNGKLKRRAVDPTPFLKVGETQIPGLKTEDRFKYLGVRFGVRDQKPVRVVDEFRTLARRARNAPLSPPQKLFLIRTCLIPKFLHTLVLSDTHAKVLDALDKALRSLVREVLHLPNDVHNAAIHSDVKQGGLGIQSFRVTVPMLQHKRRMKLAKSNCEFSQFFLSEGIVETSVPPRLGGADVVTKNDKQLYFERQLEGTCDNKQLVSDALSRKTHSWLLDPHFHMKGGDFVKAVHVRLKCLKSPSRQSRRGVGDGRCRVDRQPASLTHISQVCSTTHGLRIDRHNKFAKKLATKLRAKGWSLELEPRIPAGGTFLKPDIVALHPSGKAVVLDPCICQDSVNTLRELEAAKTAKYAVEAVRNYCEMKMTEVLGVEMQSFQAHGVPIMYRGVCLGTTMGMLESLGFAWRHIACLIFGACVDSWFAWRAYYMNTVTS